MITEDIHRVLPIGSRHWRWMCNQGFCLKDQIPESGYCARHSSKEYAITLKTRNRMLAAFLCVVVVPPVLLTVGGLLWKLALFVVFSL